MTTSDREYFDARFAQLETLIQKSVADGKAELHATIVSTVKWCASIAATTVLIFTTVVAFLMNNATHAPPTATMPAPTVIVVPQLPAATIAPSPGHRSRG